jgi:hypothetical protein
VGHDNLESCFASTVPQPPYSCRVRNKLGSKNLDAMLRIALEGPDEEVDDIIGDAIPLWKKDSKYRFLYANPFSYLNSPNTVSVSDVSSSFGAIDTNGNGTQIS